MAYEKTRTKFKVGDLVKTKSYCMGSWSLAVVVEVKPWGDCTISFVHIPNELTPALECNLELVQESPK